ncbi:MAG: hypothetical protein V4525_09375 [Pseudomonadota bacterium]
MKKQYKYLLTLFCLFATPACRSSSLASQYPTIVSDPHYEPSEEQLREEAKEIIRKDKEAERAYIPPRQPDAKLFTDKEYFPLYAYAQASNSKGIGIGTGMRVNPSWVIRAELNLFEFYYDYTKANTPFDGKLRMISEGLYADFFPTDSPIRLTTGLMLNQSKLTGETAIGSLVNFNGTKYLLTGGRASFEAKPSAAMPYIGIGYGHDELDKRSGFKFHADVGLAVSKAPTVTLSVKNAPPSVRNDPTFEPNRQQEEKIMQDTIRHYKILPVVGAGIGYTW